MSYQDTSSLNERIVKLTRKLTTLEETLSQLLQSDHPIIPVPPTFDGSRNGIEFEEWAFRVNAKLETAPIKDLDDYTKILYVATHTSGHAFSVIRSQLPKSRSSSNDRYGRHKQDFTTPRQVLDHLALRFGSDGECLVQ